MKTTTIVVTMIQTRIKMRFTYVVLPVSILIVSIAYCLAQTDASLRNERREYCAQREEVRESLIRKAQTEEYNVKLVEFFGAEYIPGRDLFKRVRMVNEGDIFTRKSLKKALRSLSGFDRIFPVSMDNVIVKLDEQDRSINILFCVTERPKK